jgi:hypothetical protein
MTEPIRDMLIRFILAAAALGVAALGYWLL